MSPPPKQQNTMCQVRQVTSTCCSFRWRERPIAVVALTARGMSSGSQSMGRGELLRCPLHRVHPPASCTKCCYKKCRKPQVAMRQGVTSRVLASCSCINSNLLQPRGRATMIAPGAAGDVCLVVAQHGGIVPGGTQRPDSCACRDSLTARWHPVPRDPSGRRESDAKHSRARMFVKPACARGLPRIASVCRTEVGWDSQLQLGATSSEIHSRCATPAKHQNWTIGA